MRGLCRAWISYGGKWTYVALEGYWVHWGQVFYLHRANQSVFSCLNLGKKQLSDCMRRNDGHFNRVHVHLLLAVLRIMEMAVCNVLVLLHKNGNSKHISYEISRRVRLGLSRLSLSYSSLSKDKWFLLLRTCGRCSIGWTWVEDTWVSMDGLFWISHLLYASLADDCITITLLNWYDFWVDLCSLFLHDRNKVSRFHWLHPLLTKT